MDVNIEDFVIAVLHPYLLSCEGLHDPSLHAIFETLSQIRLHVCHAEWILVITYTLGHGNKEHSTVS